MKVSWLMSHTPSMVFVHSQKDTTKTAEKMVGAAVLLAAFAERVHEGHGDVGSKELEHMSKEDTVGYFRENMWFPEYSPLVHEK
ncbi:NAD-dependent malic enzyme 2, mitochondrial [Stylosanthes scabra]|uniref:NAD-dependent malic enzyme 2, mitochondrial n=1 Tax=Stylosanthes scabra TaxID=79078 RepID=A0ABU6UEY7_9FABA|nr:NAD-dependent malic enzyme 2, mitochondrial [Stylosanthes scabra]